MWLIIPRQPLPDAPYWPGRRPLALADAVAWPAGWIALATQLPQPTGVVGPMIIALALVSAIGRVRRAAWENHRYRFTTWRCAQWLGGLMFIAMVLRLSLAG